MSIDSHLNIEKQCEDFNDHHLLLIKEWIPEIDLLLWYHYKYEKMYVRDKVKFLLPDKICYPN